MRPQPTKRPEAKINRTIPRFDLHHITGIREQKSEHDKSCIQNTIIRNNVQ